jgi:3-oxoacyl-(acyl-carrier-protein) synthase
MKTDLAIIGQGAVTPAGVGLKALLTGQPAPHATASLGDPKKTWPVLRVDLKDPALARWQQQPRLRRASPLTFFLVEACDQALRGSTAADRAATGLIVALSAGCLVYSRRFYEGIVRQGARAASPALFPETVFNSPGSHVASVLGLDGAAYALVGDEASWAAALKTAAVWLARGRVAQVLVLGVEEFDPLVLDAYRSARWLGRTGSGFLTSEGAAAVLLRAAQTGDTSRITRVKEGLPYRTRAEAAHAAADLLRDVDPALPCFRSAAHNWFAPHEKSALRHRATFPATPAPYLGEALTASASWNTVRALATQPAGRAVLPLWGLNHRVGLLELERR